MQHLFYGKTGGSAHLYVDV